MQIAINEVFKAGHSIVSALSLVGRVNTLRMDSIVEETPSTGRSIVSSSLPRSIEETPQGTLEETYQEELITSKNGLLMNGILRFMMNEFLEIILIS